MKQDVLLFVGQRTVPAFGNLVENGVDTLLLLLFAGVELLVAEGTAALMGDVIF